MAKEIERKYLVSDESFHAMAVKSRHIVQAYLSRRVDATVRVRIADGRGYLTVKGRNKGAERNEWEYEIPETDARAMLALARGRVISKTRWIVPFEGFTWEVDEFEGELAPLVLAEVELPDASIMPPLPPFVGEDVTGDVRYYNSSLAGRE